MADPGAAAAQASAYAGLGNTIAQLGAAGMQMAARVRQIEDGGKIAEFSARMEKTASDFSIQLMTREDTEKWPGDWQKTAEALRQEAKKLGISSGALAQFEQKFTQWNTRLTIGFETQAATKSIEIARGRVANAYQFHLDNQNYEAARDTLSTAHATGILDSVALEKGLMDTDKAARHNDVLADIETDAAVWLNDNTNPLPGYDMAEWNRLRSHARSVERQVTYEQSANVMDRIITGHISRPEQIEQEAAMLRPTERAKLVDFLASYQRAEADNLRHNPDWQAEQVGRFNALLADYVPVTGDSPDMPGLELNGIVKAMPDGPLKDDMTRQVRAVLDNQQAEAKTALDLQLAEVTAAAKRGQFDPPTAEPEEFDTDRALRDGWLSKANVQNLQGLGYSQNQAKEIVGEDDLNKRRNKFRELWQQRENKEATGRPWDEAVKDALLDGRSTFTLEAGADPDELSANRALRTGKIEIQMRDWARQHPELARDPEKIRAQLHKISGMEFRRPAARLSAPPRRAAAATGEVPTETSMTLPPATGQFGVSYQTREYHKQSKAGARQVSLDFNDSNNPAARGVEVIIPDDHTPEERQIAQRYVDATVEWFASKGVQVPSRGVKTRSENGRGTPGRFHTEPFFINDQAALAAVQNDPAGYSQVLASTLGTLAGVTFIAPHKKNDPGASRGNVNERDFARTYLLPKLAEIRNS
jgi:PAS domain-containing protein